MAPVAPVRGHFGPCGILESSKSWALYDSLPMTRTDDSIQDSSNVEDNIRVTRAPTFYITRYLFQRLLDIIIELLVAIGVRPTNKGLFVTPVHERA